MINRRNLPDILEAAAPTRLDRAIEAFAPSWGLQRREARLRIAMSEAYTGGSRIRRQSAEWKIPNESPDDALLGSVETLRERSHDLHRNNPVARGVFGTSTTAVIGTGLKLNAVINDEMLGLTRVQAAVYEAMLENEFAAWFESRFVDLAMEQNGYELQALAYRSYMIGGDVFALLPMKQRFDQPYELCVQLIEAERVSNPNWQMDSSTMQGGIERDETGRSVRVHISNKHPMQRNDKTLEWRPYEVYSSTGRRNVLHVYDRLWPGQTRGEPLLAPIIEPLKMLGRWTESELMATVLSSMLTIFIKSETPSKFGPMDGNPEGSTDTSNPSRDGIKLGHGAIIQLGNNESIEVAESKRPNTGYDVFFESMLRQIGMALEIPFEILIKHFTASYSAARAAMLEAWRAFLTRRQWFANRFCQPIYEAFVEEAVAKGRIALPGYLQADAIMRQAWLGAEWTGPGKGQIDEMKEAQAADFRIKAGLSTKSIEVPNLIGRDWEDVQRQLARENEVIDELGTAPATPDPNGAGGEPNSPDNPNDPSKKGSDSEQPDKPEDETTDGQDGETQGKPADKGGKK